MPTSSTNTTTTTMIKTEATNYASSKISNGYLIGCNEYCVVDDCLVNHIRVNVAIKKRRLFVDASTK